MNYDEVKLVLSLNENRIQFTDLVLMKFQLCSIIPT